MICPRAPKWGLQRYITVSKQEIELEEELGDIGGCLENWQEMQDFHQKKKLCALRRTYFIDFSRRCQHVFYDQKTWTQNLDFCWTLKLFYPTQMSMQFVEIEKVSNIFNYYIIIILLLINYQQGRTPRRIKQWKLWNAIKNQISKGTKQHINKIKCHKLCHHKKKVSLRN